MNSAKPAQYSISRQLYEVYKTDEENFEPYIPKTSDTDETEEETTEEETTEEDTTEEDDEEEEEDDDDGFTLHQGEILETYYYDYFNELGFENDYEDISDTGSLKIPEIIDLDRFYKGVRTRLCKTWEEPGETTNPEDIPEVFKGFITEETFSESGMELKLSGMTKLLEAEYQFTFTQMLRSKIIEEVIKTAGMIPVVDPTGLDDQVIDYTNVSSSDSDEDDDSTYTGDVPADVAKAAKQICKGKKGALAKAKAIYQWCHDNIKYGLNGTGQIYSNTKNGAQGTLEKRWGNCVDHAHLVVAMLRAVGITAKYEHSGSCYGGVGHVWAVAVINGTNYRLDASIKSVGFNQAGGGCSGTLSDSISF